MCRLILSEFKKIFKSKVIVALLVIFLGVNFFFNMRTYQSDYLTYDGPIVLEGKSYEGANLYRKLEEEASKFAGKVDKQKVETLYQEYLDKVAKTRENDTVDEEKMASVFGANWKVDYLEKVNNKTLTSDEYFEKYCEMGCDYYQDDEANVQFPIYYKNDGERKFLLTLYLNSRFEYVFDDSVLTLSTLLERNINSPLYMLANKDDFLYPKGKQVESLFYDINESDADSVAIAKHMSAKIKANDSMYHPTIANNIFLENLRSSVSVFALIVIAIMVANIFANETYYKTDQIIVPTKQGNTKITIAKVLCGISISIGVILALWIIAFIAACINLPIHDLNMVVMGQLGSYTSIFNMAFTYQEVIVCGLFVTFIAGIATAIVTMALSYFTRNRFGTIIPIILVLLLPMLFPFFGIVFKMPALDYLFPGKIMEFDSLFTIGGMYSGSPYLVLDNQVISMALVTGGVYIIMSIIIVGVMLMHSKQHQVQNR